MRLFLYGSIIPGWRFNSMGRIRHFRDEADPVYLVSHWVVNVRRYAKIPLDLGSRRTTDTQMTLKNEALRFFFGGFEGFGDRLQLGCTQV